MSAPDLKQTPTQGLELGVQAQKSSALTSALPRHVHIMDNYFDDELFYQEKEIIL